MTANALILDEASYYLGSTHDSLREALRAVPGVTNAAYQVTDNGVFVFAALVELVAEGGVNREAPNFQEAVRTLIPDATVSPEVAVTRWGVVPEPYVVSPDRTAVRHRPFGANIPPSWSTAAEFDGALARLLVGGVVSGTGDFEYRGQPMQLAEDLDPAHLPPAPVVPGHSPAVELLRFGARLSNVQYTEGFAPITAERFSDVRHAETAWSTAAASVKAWASENSRLIADALSSWRLVRLQTDSAADVNDAGEVDEEAAASITEHYPELAGLISPAAAASHFYDYDVSAFGDGDQPYRDEGFLLYLLGKDASAEVQDEDAAFVGAWVAAARVNGAPRERAVRDAVQAATYDAALNALVLRYAEAMAYLAADAKAADLRGRPITTMWDAYRIFRKVNAVVQPVSQSVQDF